MRACTSTAAGLKILTMAAMPIARYSNRAVDLGVGPHLPGANQCEGPGKTQSLADLLRDQAGQREVRGDGFQATDVAAAAATTLRIDGDMPDFTRQSPVTGKHLAAAHHRRAESAGGIDQGEVVHAAGLAERFLAQTEGVGLVQEDRPQAESLLQVAGQKMPVELVQVGREKHLLLLPVDQPGGRQPESQRGGLFLAKHESLGVFDDGFQEGVVAAGRGETQDPLGLQAAVQARGGNRALADIDDRAEHAGRLVGRSQDLGRAAQHRAGRVAFFQQVGSQQRPDQLRHRGRTDARQPHQFGPRQPPVGLHGLQDSPLVHPSQQAGTNLRLQMAAGTRRWRIIRLHGFQDCTPPGGFFQTYPTTRS